MADKDMNESYEEGSFMDRIKESPRTVSALIIILIVAAAIYAFSGNNRPNQDGQTDQVAVSDEQAQESVTPSVAATPKATAAKQTAKPVATPKVATKEQLNEKAKAFPEARKSENAYVEGAQRGEGVTHLARRATTRWLAENQADYQITDEHRIFIEDYIKDQLGSKPLSVGQEVEISFDLVKQAVEAAKTLNTQQLKGLSHYTPALT